MRSRDYRIEAEVRIDEPGAEGVLVSQNELRAAFPDAVELQLVALDGMWARLALWVAHQAIMPMP